jgi:hypothetical protein
MMQESRALKREDARGGDPSGEKQVKKTGTKGGGGAQLAMSCAWLDFGFELEEHLEPDDIPDISGDPGSIPNP